jgi:hypothetical protein
MRVFSRVSLILFVINLLWHSASNLYLLQKDICYGAQTGWLCQHIPNGDFFILL